MKQSTPQLPQIETSAGLADALGRADLLERNKLGLICSRKCFGDVILKTYDFARLVRSSDLAVVSGFQSPIEKDCLPILLRGSNPIIIVQAHRLSVSRLPVTLQSAIDAGRLLLLSPFGEKDRRVTDELAAERNRFVASMSDKILIPYAAPGGKTEELALALVASGKRVLTFDDRQSKLLAAGASVVTPDYFGSLTVRADTGSDH